MLLLHLMQMNVMALWCLQRARLGQRPRSAADFAIVPWPQACLLQASQCHHTYSRGGTGGCQRALCTLCVGSPLLMLPLADADTHMTCTCYRPCCVPTTSKSSCVSCSQEHLHLCTVLEATSICSDHISSLCSCLPAHNQHSNVDT